MMWRCGVMGGIARGIDAMPLQFYDMSLGRCNVYYAVVTLLFHTVTCICELLWKCCDIYCYTDESLCQDDIAMKNRQSVKTLYFIKCDGGDLLETNHMARLTTYH